MDGVPLHDQRGPAFGRISGGRIDIGAVEVQPAPVPSADFNSDSRVDGFDFLIWQRGVGIFEEAATKSNGNADNDADVDAADRVVWKNSFGMATVATAEQEAAAVLSANQGETALTPQLVDAAMAYARMLDTRQSERWAKLRRPR
jgi:hypothetical protein